jgi:hypothetical protein
LEFEISVHEKQRTAYIPKPILKAFGTRLTLRPNGNAAVLYSQGSDLRLVIESVKILLADMELTERTRRGDDR